MKKTALLYTLCLLSLAPASSVAEGDLTNQTPVEVHMALGSKDNAMVFSPSTLTLETGKLYKLTLENQGSVKHYFSSAGMSDAVFTRKVQINDPNGKAMAEVKGQIREIEVYPGFKAEWWFVPVKAGVFTDLRCTIEGHAQAGMTGRVVIQ